jgi:replicative DNA helicase
VTLPALVDSDLRWGWHDSPQDNPAVAADVLGIQAALGLWRDGVRREQHIPRLTIGIPRIDRATRGLQNGECFTILGRTASGKTLFAGNIVEHMLRQRPASAVLMVNLEMPCPQLIGRMLRQHFGRAEDAIERDAVADALDVEAFCSTNQNLFFMDRGAVSLEDIHVTASDLLRQIAPMPLDAIVIDHAGLLKGPRSGSAYERATFGAIGAKQLARVLNTIVVLLVQANRAGKQDDAEPVPLESARDSGAYEENADFLVALGQIVNTPGQGRPHLKARLAKNRRGPVVPVTLSFDPISLRMAELEENRG